VPRPRRERTAFPPSDVISRLGQLGTTRHTGVEDGAPLPPRGSALDELSVEVEMVEGHPFGREPCLDGLTACAAIDAVTRDEIADRLERLRSR